MHIISIIGSIDHELLAKVSEQLQECALGDAIRVEITSDGGDPDVALAIAGMLNSYDCTTVVYGQCYSAATIIFAVGKRRYMQKWAMCMVHEGSDKVKGDASKIRHFAKNMQQYEHHWNSVTAELTGTDAKVWEKLSERDTYLGAEECLKLGLATEIF